MRVPSVHCAPSAANRRRRPRTTDRPLPRGSSSAWRTSTRAPWHNGRVALTIYHYPNCSTCKKALAWLAAHRVAYTAIDIVKSPPTRAQLERAAKLANVPVGKMFNISGVSYREGDFKSKLPEMTDAQAFAALAADGKLIKRPLAVAEDVALVGFRDAEWEAALT